MSRYIGRHTLTDLGLKTFKSFPNQVLTPKMLRFQMLQEYPDLKIGKGTERKICQRLYEKELIQKDEEHRGHYFYKPADDPLDLPREIWELEAHGAQFEVILKNDRVKIWGDGGTECHAQNEEQTLIHRILDWNIRIDKSSPATLLVSIRSSKNPIPFFVFMLMCGWILGKFEDAAERIRLLNIGLANDTTRIRLEGFKSLTIEETVGQIRRIYQKWKDKARIETHISPNCDLGEAIDIFLGRNTNPSDQKTAQTIDELLKTISSLQRTVKHLTEEVTKIREES